MITCTNGQSEGVSACYHGDALQTWHPEGHSAVAARAAAKLPMLVTAKCETLTFLWVLGHIFNQYLVKISHTGNLITVQII